MGSVNRRSVNAVIEYCQLINWTPRSVYFVGVGTNHEDATAFRGSYPSCELTGFEPNPLSFESLKETFPGTLRNVALGNEIGRRDLHYVRNWKNGSSFYKPTEARKNLTTITVNVDILNTYLSNSVETLLWIDAEGHELEVLRGAKDFLEDVQVVNVEMTGKGRGEGWARPIEVHRELTEAGFRQAFVHTIRPCINQFDAMYVRHGMVDADLITCLASV